MTTATQAPSAWPRDSGLRVWYAPTWEGDRPSIAYGSMASHGVAIIEALVADPSIRIIYRPHARIGYASRKHREADRAVRACSPRPAVDTLLIVGYGWQWDFADACITDISAVAYDWLPTAKPLVITEPAASAYRPPSPLLDALSLLRASEAGEGLPRSAHNKQTPRRGSNSVASRTTTSGTSVLSRAPSGSRMQSSAHTKSNDLAKARRESEPAQEVNVVVWCLRGLLWLGSAGRLRGGPTEQQPAHSAG